MKKRRWRERRPSSSNGGGAAPRDPSPAPAYDETVGLMPAILALIKAPGEEVNVTEDKKAQHPYYRRPGKGHNHDYCDACEEGGDLICCDRCPASFHLCCHDPPVEESDIPQGQWLCSECRFSTEFDFFRPPSPKILSSNSSLKSSEGEKKPRKLRTSRSDSNVSSSSTASSRKNDKDICEKTLERLNESLAESDFNNESATDDNNSAIDILLKAAKVINPRKFELPFEMQVYHPFPGADRVETNGKRADVIRDMWGCVPLPIKLCFNCQKSCRIAPLVQCDYCPLLFHQDCLDPPLTTLPTGRWMCPNHVEHYIDWKLVNSISASERIALWEKFTGPVDQDAVRLDFLRCARRRHPPFRIRLPSIPGKNRIQVPEMVRYHYYYPPSLLPQKRQKDRINMVLKNNNHIFIENGIEEKQNVICIDINCSKFLTKNSECHNHEKHISDDDELECSEDGLKSQDDSQNSDNVVDNQENKSYLVIKPKKRKLDAFHGEQKADKRECKDTDPNEHKTNDSLLGKLEKESNKLNEIMSFVDETFKDVDMKIIKLLAYQQLQSIFDPYGNNIDDTLSELIMRNIDKKYLTRFGFNYVALPSELLNKQDLEKIRKDISDAIAPLEEVLKLRKIPTPLRPKIPVKTLFTIPSTNTLPIRAALCPVERPARNGLGDGLGQPVPMRSTQFKIGFGGCDVALEKYGTCSYVSDLHAIIFYDESTQLFELLNYSEFGTLVNGQLYSCDFSEKQLNCEDVNNAEEKVAGIREIALKRKSQSNNPITEKKPKLPRKSLCGCNCETMQRRELVAGWEGSAILTHGTVLQFGCIMFVFSIIDFLKNN